jgi:glucose-1-phosphate adenylyltransferase
MADLGVYIFNGKVLKSALRELGEKKNLDFGKDIIPYCLAEGRCISAYEFSGYWKEVGSIEQYRKANMDLIETNPDLNLYEGFWKIYTRGEQTAPVCISGQGSIEKSIVGEGSEINGKVQNSVIGPGVIISEGACVRDSIIMQESFIGKEARIDKTVVAEGVCIGDHVVIGTGEYADNVYDPVLYNAETSVIGAGARIPAGVKIGRNAVVTGRTELSDYPDGELPSGHVIFAGHRVKEGDKA